MTIIYDSNYIGKIRLFGEKFVENNKNKCYLFIDNKLVELQEFYEMHQKRNL